MTRLIVLCALLLASTSEAQVSLRKQGADLLRNVYMRAAVQEGCRTAAEVEEKLDGPGSEFPVDCAARRDWMMRMAELYGLASACDGSAAPTITIRILGAELPVSCVERAADLPLLREWLRE